MNKHKHKLITLSILMTIATGIIYVANKIISATALLKDMLDKPNGNYYHWRFGNVFYRKVGSGTPLLLVHDLTPGSSGSEWEKIEENLSQHYTLYIIDLLGCGKSDKPEITYTNFIYVQLLCDFVKNVIGEKTNIIASGLSTSFAIMACSTKSDLFDKSMLINPTSLVELNKIPNKHSTMQKFMIELPIIGTMIYHMMVSRMNVENLFMERYFFNPFHMDKNYMDAYYEAAHINNSTGKYLYSSLIGKYMNFNIIHGLKSVNNSIYVIGGKEEPGIFDIIEDYAHFNPSVESVVIEKSKHFPHIEQPNVFLEQIGIYFNFEDIFCDEDHDYV